MKSYIIFFVFFSLFFNSVTSQFYKKQEDNSLHFYGTLDFRSSIVYNESLSYYGLKLGVGNNKFRFGLGYHLLHKGFIRAIKIKNYFKPLEFEEKFYSYHQFSIYADPILLLNKRWELLLPLHLSIGPLEAYKVDSSGNERLILSRNILPSATVSIKANVRILKWVGGTVGFGYNFNLTNESVIGNDLNTVFYSFGIKIFFEEIYNMMKDKEYRKANWNKMKF